jgi:hypothetical protein
MYRDKLSRRFGNFLILVVAGILLSALCACSKKESNVFPGYKVVKDDPYHFELQIPETWKMRQADNPDSQNRLRAVGGKNKEIIIYALHSKLPVDPKKLAEQGMKLFKGESKPIATQHLPDSFFVPWLVDAQGSIKTFNNHDQFTLLFVQAAGPYGYIGVLRGPDDKELRNVITSFKATVPVKEAGYAAVNYLSVFILAAFLGESGFSFRKRLIKLQLLKTTAPQFFDSGSIKKERFRTIGRLFFAPLWCLLLYLLGMYFLESTTRTIFMIAGPILPILGYFGIIREPPDDI